jgi:hypothetical protein
MRFAPALLVAAALSGPMAVQAAPDDAFRGYRQIPCRVFVNPKADPTGDIVDLTREIQDSVYGYVSDHGFFNQSQSFCNVIDYVKAECRLMPKAGIGAAVDSLFAKKQAGRPLPHIPVCGA